MRRSCTIHTQRPPDCLLLNSFVSIVDRCNRYRVAQKTGPAYLIANILKTPRPNCVEIGELLQYYTLNAVINFFCLKISSRCGVTQRKHSYCVMLKSICTVRINDSSGVFARWRHSAMKFLNKKLMTVFSTLDCRSPPISMQFGHGVFGIFAMKQDGPVFLRHPVYTRFRAAVDKMDQSVSNVVLEDMSLSSTILKDTWPRILSH